MSYLLLLGALVAMGSVSELGQAIGLVMMIVPMYYLHQTNWRDC